MWPGAGASHAYPRLARGQEQAPQVDGNGAVEVLKRDREEVRTPADGGAGDECVRRGALEESVDPGESPRNRVCLRHVRAKGPEARMVAERSGRVVGEVDVRHRRAVGEEAAGDDAADPARAPCDDDAAHPFRRVHASVRTGTSCSWTTRRSNRLTCFQVSSSQWWSMTACFT